MRAITEAETARIRAVYATRQDDARYSLFVQGHLFLVQERERETLAALRRNGMSSLSAARILEIGCGTGYWLREFVKWGARPENVTGIDLLPDRVAEARTISPSAVTVQYGNATDLPAPAEAFDLVLQSTVFTSILEPVVRHRVAAEMLRVVKRDGLILWYDFHVNNPRNPHVRGIRRREIEQLFRGCRVQLRRITLAPPVLRRVAPYSWLACHMLSQIPWFCTHYLGTIHKR
jgi:ubiquinone/menaquinone biosynthesis C-methylase UbiE